ncbi:helix-turn-helix transcriptional regulator [Roseobacter weihaiensis]|uniref:helix-turn-helix transcriptional regulator n=1 Tax=Roseobacter weihaiensis TaxID=2763262 RepID=UPI001D0AB8AA|nr:AlpA family phage regulatory protein [Roseobacter sp. H9]
MRAIRRSELRLMVPLSDTTIYELERRGRFPRRFFLTPRCVAWDLAEVEAWLTTRGHASKQEDGLHPYVRQRKSRPVKG